MIYVDSPTYYPDTPLHYKVWSHLWSDPGEEDALHALAYKIGLQRSWFQAKDRPNHSPVQKALHRHYDVTPAKRKLALAYGAQAMEVIDWYNKLEDAGR